MGMRSVNRVVITGALARDPELRRTPKGNPVTTLRLVFTTRRKVDGNWEGAVNFIDVEVWGAQAESVVKHLGKGRQLAVDGRLEWRENSERRPPNQESHRMVADSVEFLPGARDRRHSGPGPRSVAGANAGRD